MPDWEIRNMPIDDIKREPGSEELTRSEKMKPYLAVLTAQLQGQDPQPQLAALAAIPLEDRYIWRVISALKWAFCDFDSNSIRADLHTLPETDLQTVAEPLPVRAAQFCLLVRTVLGKDAMEQIMLQALRWAKE